jgi:hypothetical protein
MTGDAQGALADLQMAASFGSALPWLSAETAVAQCLTGNVAETRRIRDELIERGDRSWIPPSAIAIVEQALGDYDAAFRWLERAYETRDFLCVVLPVEGMFELPGEGRDRAMVDDPRWHDLIRRVGMISAPVSG